MRRRFGILFIVLIVAAAQSHGQDELSATLVVLGPGDPIYIYWGHIGLAVKNSTTGEDLFYDFGNFSFYSENFYSDFAMGRMLYLGIVEPTDSFIQRSLKENQDLELYPLNMGSDELRELDRILRWWVRPENREYLYDYFLNNCSTIIRDILNEVVDGQLKSATDTVPDRNFRHYARTGAHVSPLTEIMLHFLLGPDTDKPISAWDLMFLPEALGKIALNFNYSGRDGVERTLAEEKIILKTSTRRPVPAEPRTLWPWLLIGGLMVSVLWVLAGGRKGGGVVRFLVIFIVGFPGLALAFFGVLTDHFATHGNINLWPAFPTVLIALVPLAAVRWKKREEAMAWIWTINLCGLGVAILLSLTARYNQDAGAFWAFYAPVTFTASRIGLGFRRRLRRQRDSRLA